MSEMPSGERLRIGILQDYLRNGGTERQTVWLGRAFAAEGHEVRLTTFRPGGALAGTTGEVGRRVLQGFDSGVNAWAPGLGRAVREEGAEVVLCMGRMANCRAAAVKAARPEAVVVATMRTGKALPWFYRRGLARADHVVANSRAAAETLRLRYGVPGEKVSVIHNALVFPPKAAEAEAEGGRAAWRSRAGAGPETVVMVCVAMFRPEKNQVGLVEMVARLPREGDWQLWLVGEGVGRKGCEARVAALGLGGRVKFFGFQEEAGGVYEAADLAVLASRAESLSNFLIEAQAHGLPVVAAQVQGVEECLVPGVSGEVVAPDDPEGMAAAVAGYLGDGERRRRAGEAGAARAKEAFAPERQARAYLSLFARLRGERKGAK